MTKILRKSRKLDKTSKIAVMISLSKFVILFIFSVTLPVFLTTEMYSEPCQASKTEFFQK